MCSLAKKQKQKISEHANRVIFVLLELKLAQKKNNQTMGFRLGHANVVAKLLPAEKLN